MTIQEQLSADMATSMKAGEATRTGVLRLLRSAFKYEEIKVGHALDHAEGLKLLQREAKQRKDSIEAYRTASREDLATVEETELKIISSYLPEAMTTAELEALVDGVISELGATSPAQMGAVIGGVMKRAGARADGGAVSKLVREKLAS